MPDEKKVKPEDVSKWWGVILPILKTIWWLVKEVVPFAGSAARGVNSLRNNK